MAWPKGVKKGKDKRPVRAVPTDAPKKAKVGITLPEPYNMLEAVELYDALDQLGYEIDSMVRDGNIIRIEVKVISS